MIDSFITYDSNPGALGSPSFFSKNFDDMFRFTFPDADPETHGLLPKQTPPQNTQETLPKAVSFDVFSNHSAYSTTPSTKHSPEYVASPDDQGMDDDQYAQPARRGTVAKKGIRKQYEPIMDNNMVYRYEDDPVEYRKARKRIQNRESATRVRNRKKTHVEELEEEMDIIRQERAELKVQNASLIAENNMLKQQITFLERIVARNAPEEMIDNENSFPDANRTETSESILNLMNKTEASDSILHFMNKSNDEDVENMQPSCKYFRAAPSHQFKKHVALLGVFTLLLCVYGLLPRTEPLTVQLFTKSTFGKANSLALAIKPGSESTTAFATDGLEKLVDGPKDGNHGGGSLWAWSIEIVVTLCYFVYLFYIAISAYKRHALKKKNAVLTPL